MDETLRFNSQQFISKWDFYKTMVRLPLNLFGEQVSVVSYARTPHPPPPRPYRPRQATFRSGSESSLAFPFHRLR